MYLKYVKKKKKRYEFFFLISKMNQLFDLAIRLPFPLFVCVDCWAQSLAVPPSVYVVDIWTDQLVRTHARTTGLPQYSDATNITSWWMRNTDDGILTLVSTPPLPLHHDRQPLMMLSTAIQSSRAPSVEDDEEGHLIYHTGDLLQDRCSCKINLK